MNNLKEANSKEYWKILNMRKYRNKPNISIYCFFDDVILESTCEKGYQ